MGRLMSELLVTARSSANLVVLRTPPGAAQFLGAAIDKAELDRTTGELAMVRNFRRFGTLCGQYCQFVHGHHSIEDAALFPALAAKSEALRKVTDTDGFGLNSTSYGTPFRRSASASTSSAEYNGVSVIDRRPR